MQPTALSAPQKEYCPGKGKLLIAGKAPLTNRTYVVLAAAGSWGNFKADKRRSDQG
jgi:hypothetical protein